MKLSKYLSAFLIAATSLAGFTSCDQDLDVPPVILPEGGLGGDGSAEAPFSTYGVVAKYNSEYVDMPDESAYWWATGYIVGCVVTTETVFVANDNTSVFNAPFGLASNILLAPTPDCTDFNQCIALQLPSGAVRSALNLMDNPENKGRQVTVHGYISKYLGLPGMRSIDAYNWGAVGTPGMDPAVFTKVSSVTSGKAYALVAFDGSAYQAAKPASQGSNYGWLYNQTVKVTDNTFKSDETNCFVFTDAGNGYYYITDYYGRYLYMSGTYNSFQLANAPISGDQTFFWLVTPNNDDTWTITNVGNSKVIQYSTEHTSYGAYSTIENGYVLPMLFEKDGEAPTPGGGNNPGGDTPDVPEGVWTVAQALGFMADGYQGPGTVQGVISSIDDIDTGSYGNATYYIKDNQSDSQALQVYRGYYLDGAKFTSSNQIKVGDVVVVSGDLVNYNGKYEFTSGSKIVSINGQGGSTGGDTPSNPTGTLYSALGENEAALTTGWTIDNVNIGTLERVWAWTEYNNKHYLNGSAYVSNVAYASEAYAVSPVIDLTQAKACSASFDHAAKFQTTLKTMCGFCVREEGSSTWTTLSIPSWPEAGNWTFVNSGSVDLSAYCGKKIQVAFKYGSSTAGADTWEVKNLVLSGN